MIAKQYFSYAILLVLAGFLLMPSSKSVNNIFYMLLAVPAVFFYLVNIKNYKSWSHVDLCFAAFIGYCFTIGILHDFSFAKYCLYLTLFMFIVSRLIDVDFFENPKVIRTAFWALISYVILSAVFHAANGIYELGDRIVELPSRLQGPIFTSMLIVSVLVLVTPVWVRGKNYTEAILGATLVLVCVGFILQSRTGLVGVGLWAICVCIWLTYKYRLAGLAFAIIMMTFAFVLAGGLLVESDKLLNLVARADAGRFEIWAYFLSSWRDCGVFSGCGLGFEMSDRVNGQQILHPHNIFLTLGVHLGILPLILFVLMMTATLYLAVAQKNWWGAYLAMALVLSNFDGHLVVNSLNELWLLIWLPMGLILNKHLDHAPKREQ
ncbi:hypothetical protein MPL1_04025 [Methylophaga lonarensis MPL]|uniref:O-antigen ligase-related domain-containing protein n=1 Tax=Methylophaga lonarensis MPL TaxID=1286106 RepID=M7NXZ6_9GAMM|nr:O-antigen ligase family protein [Methylophaga lonarensis]EMR13673.1 hypothetical protein MPL1_04025 [Methylophaga lonarensis MPL]